VRGGEVWGQRGVVLTENGDGQKVVKKRYSNRTGKYITTDQVRR